jgi:hypothetical protein
MVDSVEIFLIEDNLKAYLPASLVNELVANYSVSITNGHGHYRITSNNPVNCRAVLRHLIKALKRVKSGATYNWCWENQKNKYTSYEPGINQTIE